MTVQTITNYTDSLGEPAASKLVKSTKGENTCTCEQQETQDASIQVSLLHLPASGPTVIHIYTGVGPL